MIRGKDFVNPLAFASDERRKLFPTTPDIERSFGRATADDNCLVIKHPEKGGVVSCNLYLKVPVFCKAMCYSRGGFDDRRVRGAYEILMLPFPNGNCFPCIFVPDALAEIESAKREPNPYARETKVMLERAMLEYWDYQSSLEEADEQQQG